MEGLVSRTMTPQMFSWKIVSSSHWQWVPYGLLEFQSWASAAVSGQ